MIDLIKVSGHEEGNERAHELLKMHCNEETLLVMCGGLYTNYRNMLVEPNDVAVGAACVGDERYGEPFHGESNELMIQNFGVLDYFAKSGKEFYRILEGKSMQETADDYNKIMKSLFSRFKFKVGVMGLGVDLHTAGIFPHSLATKSNEYVVGESVNNAFSERITMTIKALSEFDNFLILAFSEKKREAITKLLDVNVNDEQKYPAVVYRKSPAKSYLITDVAP